MADDKQSRMSFLNGLIENLKKIEKDQHTLIEHIAKVQGEVQSAGKEDVAVKIGEVFSNASKNTQLLHETIDVFQIEYNQLKAQG